MNNRALIGATNGISSLLFRMRLNPPIRSRNDCRLVFYHGLGHRNSPCMRYLFDELPRDVFAKHIEYLQNNYDLCSLEKITSLLDTPAKVENTKALCSISFDDGLASVYTEAFPILQQQGIEFTIFLNTDCVDNKNLLWLHMLGYLLSDLGESATVKLINKRLDGKVAPLAANAVATDIEHWARIHAAFIYTDLTFHNIAKELGFDISEIAKNENLYLSWSQIEEMRSSGCTFYSHTHSHFPLGVLSDELIKSEILLSNEILRDRLGIESDFVSFPFGMKSIYGNRAPKIALENGHKYLVEVGDGINTQSQFDDEKLISRVGLGNIMAQHSQLYAAIELRPYIKHRLRSLYRRVRAL